jgi:hypothetical protein
VLTATVVVVVAAAAAIRLDGELITTTASSENSVTLCTPIFAQYTHLRLGALTPLVARATSSTPILFTLPIPS